MQKRSFGDSDGSNGMVGPELRVARASDRSFVLLRVLHLRDQLAVVSRWVRTVRVHARLLLCPLLARVAGEDVLVLVVVEVLVLVKEGFRHPDFWSFALSSCSWRLLGRDGVADVACGFRCECGQGHVTSGSAGREG